MIHPGKGPVCPKCKAHRMSPGSRTRTGKPVWVCRPRIDGKKVYCYGTTDPKATVAGIRKRGESDTPPPVVFARKLGKTRHLIITSAQNATPVHENFFQSLLEYARFNNAELLVIPLRYRNPTSLFTDKERGQEWWFGTPLVLKSGEIVPHPYTKYLWNQRKAINSNLLLMADIKIQAAASDPLSQFESISGAESAIFGHTKLQQRTIPVPKNSVAKILTTTGACTVKNYTDTKRGKIGEFHHALAAVVVEFNDRFFHLRHVNADARTGEFTDITLRYSPGKTSKAPRPLAVILGDTHVDFIDPLVEQATFGKGGIVPTVNPENLVFHDLNDDYAINPHHAGNPFNAIAKLRAGRNSVADEIRRAIVYVDGKRNATRECTVVSSNHDDFLRRWIIKADWKEDPENAETYLKLALSMVQATALTVHGTEYPSPFQLMLAQHAPKVRALEDNDSFVLGGVELGMHGDRGPNGARGSIKNLRRIGTRSIIGHSHTPGIEEGCYQTGTSTNLRLEYNLGPSSWMNTHCILHHDGKRQLINIINGKWRL